MCRLDPSLAARTVHYCLLQHRAGLGSGSRASNPGSLLPAVVHETPTRSPSHPAAALGADPDCTAKHLRRALTCSSSGNEQSFDLV
jgi:hypothetical protein